MTKYIKAVRELSMVHLTYPRLLKVPPNLQSSLFLFGPRGTGKTSWLKTHFSEALYIDLLHSETYSELLANPSQLEKRIPQYYSDFIIIDEIQKIPPLLNEVHRLIASKNYRFILTGSSARSLRRKGVNLLAGRALNYYFHPLIYDELKNDFSLEKSTQVGLLPSAYTSQNPTLYLKTYITTYLREEILQEGVLRNLSDFSRFLEIASFSQGSPINLSEIARDAALDRRVVSAYFDILADLLIGYRLPSFTKRAKRRLITHSKFYFFDAGVYRAIRPKGPLDATEEIDGPVLETLFLTHLRAINDYYQLNYQLFFWQTSNHIEVDFVVYGEKGFFAFEIKRKKKLSSSDFKGLRAFAKDYPEAKLYLLYGGDHEEFHDQIIATPYQKALFQLKNLLSSTDFHG